MIRETIVRTNINQVIKSVKQTKELEFIYNLDNPNERSKLTIKNDNGYNAKILFSNYGFMFTGGGVYPVLNKNQDFGANGYYWKNIYLVGKLISELGEAKIDDLINLVAYAKTQGWIN